MARRCGRCLKHQADAGDWQHSRGPAGRPNNLPIEFSPDRLVPEAMQRLCATVSGPLPGQDWCGEVVALVAKSEFPIYDRREGKRTGVWRTLLVRVNPLGDMWPPQSLDS